MSSPGGRGWGRRAAALVVVGGAAVVLGGCSAVGDPVTDQGDSVQRLWIPFLVLAAFFWILVWGLVLFCVVRFRSRGGDRPPPSQKQYVIPLEIFYTVVPIVIVVGLFGISMVVQRTLDRLTDDPAVVIDVEGFQWQWQFRYPDLDVQVTGLPEVPPEMVIPVGQTVRLRLHSDDVNHSFWPIDFLTKRDLIPGVDNQIDVTANETGTYQGRCAEYCGLDHWKMWFTVRIVTPAEFQAWAREHRDTSR